MSMIKLKKGDKIIERKEDDYKKNLNYWEIKGYRPVEKTEKKPKKKKSK